FSNGAYDPATQGGQHVLAHELAHVVQGNPSVRRLWGFGNTGRTEEEERAIIDDARAGAGKIADQVKARLRPAATPGRAGRQPQAPDVRTAGSDTVHRLLRLPARRDAGTAVTAYAT